MKRLSTKEKAERYEKTIRTIKSKMKNGKCHILFEEDIIDIFPELKKSEDEMMFETITKGLHDLVNDFGWSDFGDIPIEDILIWLKKQGKQKLANKVKSKFHEGDWIIHHGTENIYQVVAVIDNQYQLKYGDKYTIQNCVNVDRCTRLWDITKDAKDGDILVTVDDKRPFIYKGRLDPKYLDSPVAYCGINTMGYFQTCEHFQTNNDKIIANRWTRKKVQPATKEQRNLLFQKMKKAKYEWDAEKKVLKKIEHKPTVWSEEDEKMFMRIRTIIHFNAYQNHKVDRNGEELDIFADIKKWLNSIKDRLQHQTNCV